MAVLTIGHADIKRLCSIPSADTSQDSAIEALISAEQVVHEYSLDPGILTASGSDAGLLATLVLGVSERMAGSYLEQLGRAVGFTDDFVLGSLHVQASRNESIVQLGAKLAALGARRLAPFERAGRRISTDAAGTHSDNSTKIPLLVTGPTSASVFDSAFGGSSDA